MGRKLTPDEETAYADLARAAARLREAQQRAIEERRRVPGPRRVRQPISLSREKTAGGREEEK